MKLNKSILTMLAVAAAVTLSSCADSSETATEIAPNLQLSIQASVRDASSRVIFDKDKFQNKDQIGLFIIPGEGSRITEVQETVATYNNGQWKMDRIFDMADFTSVQVMAYYPYEGIAAIYNEGSEAIEYKAINIASNQKDLLTSTLTEVDKSTGVASLEFCHTLTCLSLNISKAPSYEGNGRMSAAYIEGGYNDCCLLSTGDKTWVFNETEKGDVKVMDSNVTLTQNPYKCQVLVFPSSQKSVYRLVLTVDNKDYLYNLPLEKPYAGLLSEYYITVDTPIQNTPDEIYFNGHKGIYLGTNSQGQPLYWAQENVGATSMSDPGMYFEWGSVSAYDPKNASKEPLSTTGSISGTSYDAARAVMGSEWRMPTVDEYNDLLYRCTSTQTDVDAASGWTLVGPNSNSIFMPNGGCYFGERLYSFGEAGYFWTANGANATSASVFNLSWASPMILPSWNKAQACNIRAVISL